MKCSPGAPHAEHCVPTAEHRHLSPRSSPPVPVGVGYEQRQLHQEQREASHGSCAASCHPCQAMGLRECLNLPGSRCFAVIGLSTYKAVTRAQPARD